MKKQLLVSAIVASLFSLPAFSASENVNSPMFGDSRDALYTEFAQHDIDGSAFTASFADKLVKSVGKKHVVDAINAQLNSMKTSMEDFSTFKTTTTQQLPVLKKFDADMYEYVQRLATLTSIDIEDLWVSFYMDAAWVADMEPKLIYAWNHKSELKNTVFSDMLKGRGGCTTAAWDNGIVGGNEDFASIWGGTSSLVTSDDLMFEGTYYGAYRAQGKHLGLVVNTLVADSLGDGANGLPHPIIIASIVKRAQSVPEAMSLLEQIKGESPFNYTMADDKGNAIAYNILKKDASTTVEPVNGAVTHTNHRTSSKEKMLEAWGNDYQLANSNFGYSIARREAADLLTRIVPNDERNAESMKTILRTQPILMKAARGEDFGTIYSFVMDVPQGCIYMTPDRPDLTDYKKVCFK